MSSRAKNGSAQAKPAVWPTATSRGPELPWPCLSVRTERVRRQIAEQFVPGVLLVLLDFSHHFTHLLQNRRSGVVVNIALQKLQHVQTIAVIVNEVGEQHVQPVIDGDEVVPVLGTEPQGVFVCGEALPREIVLL